MPAGESLAGDHARGFASHARDALRGLALGDAFDETWFRLPPVARAFADEYAGDPRRGYGASAGGDVDTTCAITGGIVAARTGAGAVPAAWLEAREPLPAWTDGPAMR